MVMLSSDVQPSNASSPMVVTLSGIFILSIELQPRNVKLFIDVPFVINTFFNDSGTKNSVAAPLYLKLKI